ncbi:uncharacterized protein YhaN [Paenibacillus castaneae]|uniref:AAA family ATPase n=1 Tax=Paenibacillus castaneae TaxID=474957 RepID=UPI000C9A682F|nr:AAA family ATPase [Paenibacillus castaneae]NIK75273.1 uncharacterized protein YhaN [Paenibacillus castaneae]
MKLLKAEIDGFGQLFGRSLELDADVIIVYGPNEAGKSTMFGFIRSMLYGFSKRGQAADRQEPVNGGKHGGRLFWSDEAGERYVLERYSADSSGKLKLRALGHLHSESGSLSGFSQPNIANVSLAEGAVLLQADWERQFLGGISEQLYRQLFAVTLTELQEVGALSGDELGRYLYQAGWDSGKSIGAAEKRLAQEMESLFKPRGANQQINQQLKTLEQLEAELRKRADGIAAYNELTQRVEKLEAELLLTEAELPRREAVQLLLNKACSVRPLWMRKQKLLIDRDRFAYAGSLPPQAEKSWEELLRKRAERREEVESYRQKALLLELQLEAITYDEQLLQIADETEELLQRSEGIRKLKQDLAGLEVELREHDDVIARLVSSIAPEWTERQLREFHVTIADRDQVRSAKQQELDLSRTEERFAAELETLKQQEREAAIAWEEADAAVRRDAASREQNSSESFALLPRNPAALKAAWNAVDSALREWELERVRTAGAAADASASEAGGRGAAAAGRGGVGLLWAAAAAAGGAALALGAAALSGAAAGEGAGGAGVAVLALAGAALAAAVAAVMRSRSGRSRSAEASGGRMRGRGRGSAGSLAGDALAEGSMLREREHRIHKALETMVREPAEAAAALLTAKHHSSPEHLLAAEQARSQLRAAVEARLEALQSSERLIGNRAELASRLDRLRALMGERSNAAAAAAHTKQAAALQWGGWLAARALPDGMSPSAALEAFELAEQAVQRLQQYDRLTAKKYAAGNELAAFTAQAAALCGRFKEAENQLAADAAIALRLLHAEIRRHEAAKQEAKAIEARRAELFVAMQAAEAGLKELQSRIGDQMALALIHNESEYEAALSHLNLLQELDLELSKLELEITAGMSMDRVAELESLFAANDEEQLQAMRTESAEELAKLEKQKHEQLELRGRLRQSIEHLLKEDEQHKLLTQKEMTVAQLEADVERYAVLSISAALIRRTKRIYEEERQPVVLRNASSYIALLTGGKYIRILTAPGEPGIRLESSDHRLIDSTMLSRGTAEQVYLAMRFALAEEAAHGTKLPLMLDDVFVNFDRGRLHAVIRLLAELAGKRQIIVMTCHEHVRDAMLEHCQNAALVHI